MKWYSWLFFVVGVIVFEFALLILNRFGIGLSIISDYIGLVTAIFAVIGLLLQYRVARQEQDSFRQQLIAVLHHAEGITDSFFAIENMLKKRGDDLALLAAIEACRKNAASLQMGLMETKVGGKQLSDDLDKSYKEWAQKELELRILPMKKLIEEINSGKVNIGSS